MMEGFHVLGESLVLGVGREGGDRGGESYGYGIVDVSDFSEVRRIGVYSGRTRAVSLAR